MKRALIGITSVGILAVTVGVETADAQSYRRYGPARAYSSQAYTPQSRGAVRRGGCSRQRSRLFQLGQSGSHGRW